PPMSTVSITLISVPLTDNALTDLSTRFATSARLPVALKLRPDGCLPTVTVLASLGGSALRSMTYTLLSGAIFRLSPSLVTSIESATSATELVGSMATWTGGPTTEVVSGQVRTNSGVSLSSIP